MVKEVNDINNSNLSDRFLSDNLVVLLRYTGDENIRIKKNNINISFLWFIFVDLQTSYINLKKGYSTYFKVFIVLFEYKKLYESMRRDVRIHVPETLYV
jgi:hypothetical protein